MRTAAYVYTGWHPIAERDASFHPGFTEWELVRSCRPRFAGHAQPRVPLLGEYDDRDPVAFGKRIALAHRHGVDALVFGSPSLRVYLNRFKIVSAIAALAQW